MFYNLFQTLFFAGYSSLRVLARIDCSLRVGIAFVRIPGIYELSWTFWKHGGRPAWLSQIILLPSSAHVAIRTRRRGTPTRRVESASDAARTLAVKFVHTGRRRSSSPIGKPREGPE